MSGVLGLLGFEGLVQLQTARTSICSNIGSSSAFAPIGSEYVCFLLCLSFDANKPSDIINSPDPEPWSMKPKEKAHMDGVLVAKLHR